MRRLTVIMVCGLVLGCATTGTEKTAEKEPDPAYASAAPSPAAAAETKAPRREAAAPAAGPDAAVPAAPRDPRFAALMRRMTLRERIAQRFITFIPRNFSREETEELLRENKPAGVILYKWNYRDSDDVRTLSRLVHSTLTEATGGVGPFICADQEGGRVTAFPFGGMVRLPSQYELGRSGSASLVGLFAYINAVQMKQLGLNMNLAPVLDLTDAADRSVIGDRSYGGDPEQVSRFARAYVDAAAAAKLIPVAKHFPGHGITRVDSHKILPVADATADELQETHNLPFKAAVDAGIGAVMTAHILYPAIDGEFPATLSKRILTDILRNRLGFDGVIMSDGIEMGAISRNYSVRETVKTAITAGVDIMLVYLRYPIREMIDLVENLVAEGELTEEDIDRGTERILRLKFKYDLLDIEG
jgi:beta-N-acetylhexosaminidase